MNATADMLQLVWPLVFLLIVLIVLRQVRDDVKPIVKALVEGSAKHAGTHVILYILAFTLAASATADAVGENFGPITKTEWASMGWWQIAALFFKSLKPAFVAISALLVKPPFPSATTQPPSPTQPAT